AKIRAHTVAGAHRVAFRSGVRGVMAGRDIDYESELSPGDGRRLTLDEIKSASANRGAVNSGGAKPASAEDKAKLEELKKKNAEIVARNEKALKSNEIVARTFQAGNEAFTAKNYDEAIKQYEEGVAADPEQHAL